MTLILDASVAIKLVYNELGSAESRSLLERVEERIAPDWMMVEVASALANKVRHENAPIALVQRALAALPEFVDRTVRVEPLLERAIQLSVQIGHALYDSMYLLLALEEDGQVITADDGFVKAVTAAGYGRHVERLQWPL